MKISVIIPVYKVEAYLGTCVDSVLSQTYRDIEVILVDDGSPDNCPTLCDDYGKRDPRVKVVHKENGGLSDARNVGLTHATGEYVVFLDSDDFYVEPDAIRGWAEMLFALSADLLIFRSKKYYPDTDIYDSPPALRIDPKKVYAGEEICNLMEQGLFQICAWDKVISRRFLTDHGIDFIYRQHSEDMAWCIKLLSADARICVDSRVCHAYRRQNSTSLTRNITVKAVNDVASVIQAYASSNEPLSQTQLLINHFAANIYVQWLNLSVMVPGDSIPELLKQMPKYMYLLNYRAYPYVRTAAKMKFLGFHGLRRLINLYYRYRMRKQ